jgi:hypothetical protein
VVQHAATEPRELHVDGFCCREMFFDATDTRVETVGDRDR